MHVIRSLRRSLEGRGHSVYMTGKLTSGFEFIQGQDDVSRVENEIRRVQVYAPDLIIIFRPSALPFHYLQLLRSTGTRIFAWFSDDPVLWNYTYRESVDEYDVVLHCGNYKILDFYEKRFGRPTGVNFPFWTDQFEFPYSYTEMQREKEVVFFGNVSDSIRRQRYYDLAKLKHAVTIYGKSDPDYFALSGGYLDFNHEIIKMARNSKVSINIPQFFEVRHDDESWFEGLDELGSFEIPSRVVQSAALGIPMVSIESSDVTPSAFKSAIRTSSIDECDRVLDELESEGSYARHSSAVFEEFLRFFTADSRSMALESLMKDESWKQLDAMDRSVWYRKFDALGEREPSEFMSRGAAQSSLNDSSESQSVGGHSVFPPEKHENSNTAILIGERWKDFYSNSSIILRSMSSTGRGKLKFDLFGNGKNYKLDDPSGSFQSLIDIKSFAESVDLKKFTPVFIGSKFYPHYDSKTNDAIKIQFHLLEEELPNRRTDRIVATAHVVSFLSEKLYLHYKSRGNTNVLFVSDVFEPAPSRIQGPAVDGIRVLVQRRGHLKIYEDFINAAVLLGARVVVAEDYYSDRSSERLLSDLAANLTLILPDPSRAGNLGSKFISHALQVSHNVGVVRGSSSFSRLIEPNNLFMFSSVQEMIIKSRNAVKGSTDRKSSIFGNKAGVFSNNGFMAIEELIVEGIF